MTGLGTVLPKHGGRVALRRAALGAQAVHYEAVLMAEDERHAGEAIVTIEDGHVRFEGLAGSPEWLLTLARTLLRGAWRSRDAGWPSRITRWRPEPSGRKASGSSPSSGAEQQ